MEKKKSFSEQILRVKGTSGSIPSILVGNKIDLADQRQISAEEAAEMARQWSTTYIETSAKSRHNVDKVYNELLRLIRPTKAKTKVNESGSQRENMEVERVEEKKPCCIIL